VDLLIKRGKELHVPRRNIALPGIDAVDSGRDSPGIYCL
jgi:hypothetical protein